MPDRDRRWPSLDIRLTPDGAARWAALAKRRVGAKIAIMFGSRVLAAPTVTSAMVVDALRDGHLVLTLDQLSKSVESADEQAEMAARLYRGRYRAGGATASLTPRPAAALRTGSPGSAVASTPTR